MSKKCGYEQNKIGRADKREKNDNNNPHHQSTEKVLAKKQSSKEKKAGKPVFEKCTKSTFRI